MEHRRAGQRRTVVKEAVEKAQQPCPRCEGKLIAVLTRKPYKPYFLKCMECDYADG